MPSVKNPKTPPQPAAVFGSTKKPPLVLVHGFRGAPLGLKVIADDLRAAGYEVHVPALPPFAGARLKPAKNKSATVSAKRDQAPAESIYSPKSYARYLRDYCEKSHLLRPILIGHSMGSIVVAATARHYPAFTHQKLVLLSPISTKPPRFIARLSPLANHLPSKVIDYITTRFLFVPHSRKRFREALAITHQCSSDTPPRPSDLSAAMQFSTNHSVAEFLAGSTKDIIIIAGAKDHLIKRRETERLARAHSAVLEFIPGSGHLHNYEKPHETAKLILKHLP